MFGSSVSLKSLAILCRSLSTLLHTGVAADRAFDIAGQKSGSPTVRRSCQQISQELSQGNDVAGALQSEQLYPELMVNMIAVGEQTGSIPEILDGLANHYDNLLRLRKDFVRSISWPVLQLVLAVFVIAGLIFVLGLIAESNPGESVDMLGWGLMGVSGALTWLGLVFGFVATVYIVYRLIKASFAGQKYLDSLLLRIPVLGTCLQSFAIARFSWAYHLTQEAGMGVDDSITASMKATNNGAFLAAGPEIIARLQGGQTVTEALTASGLFPQDVLAMVHVGETSGTVPETLHRLSPQFEEQARRSLDTLAGVMGWVVWVIVAGFIIFVVFSIFLKYVGMINELSNGI